MIKKLTNIPYAFLRFCLETRGLRKLGHAGKSPAFYTPRYPRYGKLSESFTNQAGEIRIAGFPKSGNVWITSLIASCLDIDVTVSKNRCRVTHTHECLNDKDLFNKKILRGAVLLRDLRDVIVSIYHFMNTEHFKKFAGHHHIYNDFESMYTDFFLPYIFNKRSILETLPTDYVRFGWPVIRYEKFWDNTEAELKRLFQIWDIEITDEKIRESIRENSLDSMRAGKGKTTTEVQPTHFRKGGYGNYKEIIPPHILADIEDRFGDYLRRWGYKI